MLRNNLHFGGRDGAYDVEEKEDDDDDDDDDDDEAAAGKDDDVDDGGERQEILSHHRPSSAANRKVEASFDRWLCPSIHPTTTTVLLLLLLLSVLVNILLVAHTVLVATATRPIQVLVGDTSTAALSHTKDSDSSNDNSNTTESTTCHYNYSSDTQDHNDEKESTIQSDIADRYQVTNVTHGMVASDHAICSQRAVSIILQQLQGNAVDAAVYVAICLGIVNPASSGLGGGAFVLLHHVPHPTHYDDTDADTDTSYKHSPHYHDARIKTNNTTKATRGTHQKINEVIDCRERAPISANTTMYRDLPSNASVLGALAIPIMGELHCLYLAHYRFGSLSWSTILQPLIELASNGIVVGTYLAKQIHDTATHHYRIQQLQQQQEQQHNTNRQNHHQYDTLRTLITHHNNWSQPLVLGDIMYPILLARTLQQIALHGIDAIYRDPVASTLAQEIQSSGPPFGIVQSNDYKLYRPTIHTPLLTRHINGYTIMGVPPPSSGGAAILGAMRFLSNFTLPLSSYKDTLTMHRIVEACKHVFAMRMGLSDPDYNTDTVQTIVHDLVVTSYMEVLRTRYYMDATTLPLSQYGGSKWAMLNDTQLIPHQNITDAQEGDRIMTATNPLQPPPPQRQRRRRKLESHSTDRSVQRSFGYLDDHGTSHFSVVDQYGNAVAMTTSINTNFGSHVLSPSTGILFSNTMDDFSKPDLPNHYGLKPSVSNYIQSQKRPLSSMSPTMVFRETSNHDDLGDLVLVLGASGGPKIITAVLQVLLRTIYLGENLLDAVLYPRVHDQLLYHGGAVTAAERAKLTAMKDSSTNKKPENDSAATILEYDITVSKRTRDALQRRFHDVIDIDFSGTVQAIGLDYEMMTNADSTNTNTNRHILTGVSDPRKDGAPAGY
jgi:gamma-glutamyltranspeptidase